MKICVTATGDNFEAAVDPRFGRCAFFMIVDTDSLEFQATANPNVSVVGGAGIQSAQLVAKSGARAVVTGNVGPNAVQSLSSLGLKVFTGASGTVKEAIENYKAGKYNETNSPTVPPGH